MIAAIEQFKRNLAPIKELHSFHALIHGSYPMLASNSEDILRSEIVLLVSALDCFIHDCVRLGMLEIFMGVRPTNDCFENYHITLKGLVNINSSTTPDEKLIFLEKCIREKNSRDSYQSPRSIEYALSFIAITKLWSKLSAKLNTPSEDIKNRLSLIIDRRNKIAHEADLNPITGLKYSIKPDEIISVIKFIESLCENIYEIVS